MAWLFTFLMADAPVIGEVILTTDSGTGTLEPTNPPNPFPALNTNQYDFRVEIETVGTFLSATEAEVAAIINEIPPTATYTLQNGPVGFFQEGDPGSTIVFTLDAATTDVTPGVVGIEDKVEADTWARIKARYEEEHQARR